MSDGNIVRLGALAVAFTKIQVVFVKLIKGFKSFKVLGAVGSAAAYTGIFNLKFALILLALIGFHEYGHVKAMKWSKMKTRGFYFIPLFGGAAVPDEEFKSRKQETYVALMGPVFGLAMTLLVFLLWYFTGSVFFAAIAVFYAFINLINLLPINPLDGGRVLKSLVFSARRRAWKWLSFLMVLLGMVFFARIGAGLIAMFLALGFADLITSGGRMKTMPKMNAREKRDALVAYSVIVLLFLGMYSTIAHSLGIDETSESMSELATSENDGYTGKVESAVKTGLLYLLTGIILSVTFGIPLAIIIYFFRKMSRKVYHRARKLSAKWAKRFDDHHTRTRNRNILLAGIGGLHTLAWLGFTASLMRAIAGNMRAALILETAITVGLAAAVVSMGVVHLLCKAYKEYRSIEAPQFDWAEKADHVLGSTTVFSLRMQENDGGLKGCFACLYKNAPLGKAELMAYTGLAKAMLKQAGVSTKIEDNNENLMVLDIEVKPEQVKDFNKVTPLLQRIAWDELDLKTLEEKINEVAGSDTTMDPEDAENVRKLLKTAHGAA